VLALEDLLAPVDRLDGLAAGLRVVKLESASITWSRTFSKSAGSTIPSGSRPARLIETPSPVERIVVNALVLDQFTDCGSETFPCRPRKS
jgi:hypothetical protein